MGGESEGVREEVALLLLPRLAGEFAITLTQASQAINSGGGGLY